MARWAIFALQAAILLDGAALFAQALISAPQRKRIGSLLLHKHQFAIFDFDVFDVVRQLELIALLGQFLLQHLVHQRCWYAEIADLEFGGVKGSVAVFGAEMSG